MKKTITTTPEDRRRFFRIDDEVNLSYKSVDERMVYAASQVTDDLLSNCSLAAALDMLDQESRLIMHRIEKNEPEIAEYLKLLDTKIGLLAQSQMQQGNDFSESHMRNANISAAGIAFESENAIDQSDHIEIKLLLTSCRALIVIYGKVVYCNEIIESEGSINYHIGVDFINLKDQDREVLIKHVVKRQMQQIRDQKTS